MLNGALHTGVMHLSNDADASDAESFQRSNEALSVNVKCELKMETDEEKPWTDESQQRPQFHSAYDLPDKGCNAGLRRISQDEIQSRLRNTTSADAHTICEQIPEELHPVSRLTTSGGSFPDELHRVEECGHPAMSGARQESYQHLQVNECGNPAVSDVRTCSSDKTRQESYQVSRLEASRPYQKEPQNVDQRKDWKLYGAQSNNTGDVQPPSTVGQTNEATIVGHASHDRSHEVILSTPFGTFHRAPLSFWPAKGAGEQSTSSSHHRTSTADGVADYTVNTELCNQKRQSLGESGYVFVSAQNVTATGNEATVPRKVIIRSFLSAAFSVTYMTF